MTKSEFLEIINNGENSGVEFKLDDISPPQLAEEIIAFVNFEGGMILLGVDDTGKIQGIKRNKIEEWIMNVCRENVIPGIIPYFEKIKFDDKEIAVIKIPKGVAKPYQTKTGKFLIRVGSTKRLASREELVRLFQTSAMIHYDITPIENTSIWELDIRKIEDYFLKFRGLNISQNIPSYPSPVIESNQLERLLINTEIMIEMKGEKLVTIAGMLLFGKNSQQYLFQSGITAAAFKGTELDYEAYDKREISGTLIDLENELGEILEPGIIDQAIKFVMQNTRVSSTLKGNKRVDRPDYPAQSIREAIVNAVAHRDYSIIGSRIRLFIFEDRIEIKSPGKLPNTVTIEKMKEGCSFARNPTIVRFLQNYGYMEKFGLGIPMKIIKMMREYTGKEPELKEYQEEFSLTLYK